MLVKTNFLDPDKFKNMSTGAGHLGIAPRLVYPEAEQHQHLTSLPRSISIADLQAGSKASMEHPRKRLLRHAPSVSSLRSPQNVPDVVQHVVPHSETHLATKPQHYRHATLNPSNTHMHDEKKLRRKMHYKSYQDVHILSMYQDNASVKSTSSRNSSRSTEFELENGASTSCSESGSSQESSPMPRTPIDQEMVFKSSLAGQRPKHNKPHHTSERSVHVIEYRQEKQYLQNQEDGEIIPMQATVLTVPGKPRLIQIHRPQLSNYHPRSIPNMQAPRPSTPTSSRPEVSTFSPYDTPNYGTPFSDLSRTASEATPTPKIQPRLSINTNMAMLHQHFSTPSSEQPLANNVQHSTGRRSERQLADPFGSLLTRTSSLYSSASSLVPERLPQFDRLSTRDGRYSSERSIPHGVQVQNPYNARLITAISSTSKAFDVMVAGGLYLESVELSPFRGTTSQNNSDDAILHNLRIIFPGAALSLLSTLAAWLLIDRHFTQLLESSMLKETKYVENRGYFDLDIEPTTSPSWSMRDSQSQRSEPRATMTPPFSYPEYGMSSPPHAARVPSKAMSVLGIRTDPAGCKARPFTSVNTRNRVTENPVEEHARSAHKSVQTMGRKLVKDLVALPTSPASSMKQRSVKVRRIRGRSSIQGSGSSSPSDEVIEGAVVGLWEACRRIASLI
ncbi:hypothetical protein LTR64_007806 [Lithohypha guttulata]|uniref:uncharacterized protein n=1 Tax=Lithohypha guttulata TaxID=1690604 RepID=UPI002DE1E75C|nr:hypothetical protein LTR51_007318 [Lithohypha guttulata]